MRRVKQRSRSSGGARVLYVEETGDSGAASEGSCGARITASEVYEPFLADRRKPRVFPGDGEIETVKRAGRWTSSAVQRYLWDGGKQRTYLILAEWRKHPPSLHMTELYVFEGEFGGSEPYLIVDGFGDAAIYGGSRRCQIGPKRAETN